MNEDLDQLTHTYIKQLYQQIEPLKVPQNDLNKQVSSTSGEVLYHSINKLIATVSLKEDDIFLDLGSGMGKVVVQFFLKSVVKEAWGIEYLPELIDLSAKLSALIQRDLPEFYAENKKLKFISGNFLEIDFDFATVVFINSICFSQKTLEHLGKLIENNPNIHTVMSLRPLPNLYRLPFLKTVSIECSWDSALCYVYKSDTNPALII